MLQKKNLNVLALLLTEPPPDSSTTLLIHTSYVMVYLIFGHTDSIGAFTTMEDKPICISPLYMSLPFFNKALNKYMYFFLNIIMFMDCLIFF